MSEFYQENLILSFKSKITKILAPIIIIILGFAFFKLMVATRGKAPEIKIQEHVWRVEQTRIKKQKLAPVITLYGKTETNALFNAAAPATSEVVQLEVKEGEFVEQGKLMLALDPQDFKPQIMQAQAKVNELQALISSEKIRHEVNLLSLKNEQKLLKLNEKALQRAEKIKRQNLASVSETEQAMQQVEKQRLAYNSMKFKVSEHEARLEQLKARLVQAQADLQKSHLAMQRSQIFAPFAGVVAKVNVALGDRVNSNEKLLSFYSMQQLDIRAKLPINILGDVQDALKRGEVLKGTASNGDRHVDIVLVRLSGEAQASGVDAIFTIDPADTSFRIGSIVVVRLQRNAQDDLIKVPYEAMYGMDRLYKIVDRRLQKVKVTTIGEAQLDETDPLPQLLVRSDELKNGDTILSTHLPNAVSGLKVQLAEQISGADRMQNTQ